MSAFTTVHQDRIAGKLTCFDRLLFKTHAKEPTTRAGRPYEYLATAFTRRSGSSREDLGRRIAERDDIDEGLVCVLAAVEPCMSLQICKSAATCRLELVRRARKCLHCYWYVVHRDLGSCQVRLQGWSPFEIQVW